LVLHLEGQWTLASRLPYAAEVLNQATVDGHVAHVSFDSANLKAWDSGFIIFLRAFLAETSRSLITCDLSGLPEGVRRLLALITAVPERKDMGRQARRPSMLARIGSPRWTRVGPEPSSWPSSARRSRACCDCLPARRGSSAPSCF